MANTNRAIAQGFGYVTEESWYDMAFNSETTVEDEIEKAKAAFSRG